MINENLKNIFDEIFLENGDFYKNFETKMKATESEYEKIHQKIIDHIEKSCPKEFEWLNNNSLNHKEYDSRFKEFESCAERNDFGYKAISEELNTKQQSLSEEQDLCIISCQQKLKATGELKNCLNDCLVKSTNLFSNLLDDMKPKMDELNSKL